MVEKEKYCVDIITQIEAAREALTGIENLILRNHLETHTMHQMKHGRGKKAVTEILKIYNLARK
jgi:DNA-binding FrmR family transcriptional regulator